MKGTHSSGWPNEICSHEAWTVHVGSWPQEQAWWTETIFSHCREDESATRRGVWYCCSARVRTLIEYSRTAVISRHGLFWTSVKPVESQIPRPSGWCSIMKLTGNVDFLQSMNKDRSETSRWVGVCVLQVGGGSVRTGRLPKAVKQKSKHSTPLGTHEMEHQVQWVHDFSQLTCIEPTYVRAFHPLWPKPEGELSSITVGSVLHRQRRWDTTQLEQQADAQIWKEARRRNAAWSVKKWRILPEAANWEVKGETP